MTANSTSHFALVLPGAVARGAYEAGVIQVMADQDIHVDRIVATSSGALNGLVYASGIRAGREDEMAAKLTESWIKNGSWENSLNLNLWGLLGGRGLSNPDGLMKMMREMIVPCTARDRKPVELRIIVTPLNGIMSRIGRSPATTYECILKFADEDFDTQEGLEKMFKAVTAACAFPGLFEPVEIEGLGPCVDGGAVNNAPIKYALEENDVSRVIMPIPFPAVMEANHSGRGFGLLGHLIQILINERLFRDLKEAQSVNLDTQKLRKLQEDGKISMKQFELIKETFCVREVEITEIRPHQVLKCSPFSGFFHQGDRKKLIHEGRRAARETLAQIPPRSPKKTRKTGS